MLPELSSSSSVESWYGNYYPAQRIQSLPRSCLLPNSARLVIDYARLDDRSICLDFINDSAKQGRGNVGEDEFEGPFADRLEILLSISQIFAARDPHSQQAKAFIVVSPSICARTFDINVAGLFVFLEREFQTDALVYQHLMRLATDFALELCLGYSNAIVQVSSSEHDFIRLLRQDGFLRVGTLHECVKTAGIGLCDNIILAKRLSEASRPKRPLSEMYEFIDKIFPEDESCELYKSATLPTIDFLPVKYFFASGVKVTCRNMKKDEDSVLYEIWRSAAAKGLGYGVDEVPTLAVFRMSILLDHYCVVFEELETGKIVGVTFLTTSYYTRTNEIKAGETSLLITEEFRGKKIGGEAVALELGLLKELGFKISLNDALSSNHRMSAIFQHRKFISGTWGLVGIIPDGCYVEGYGWDDQVILLLSLDGILGFTEQAKQTLKGVKNREESGEEDKTKLSKL